MEGYQGHNSNTLYALFHLRYMDVNSHDGLPPYISTADNVIEINQYKLCYLL